jgi:hypothetical protein
LCMPWQKMDIMAVTVLLSLIILGLAAFIKLYPVIKIGLKSRDIIAWGSCKTG